MSREGMDRQCEKLALRANMETKKSCLRKHCEDYSFLVKGFVGVNFIQDISDTSTKKWND